MMRAAHALIGSASPDYVMRGPRPTWLPAGEHGEHKEPLTDSISIRKACQAPAREPETGKPRKELGEGGSCGPGAGARPAVPLLDLDGGSGLFQLGLDLLVLVLADAFVDGLGSAVDQVLGLLEPKARDLPHHLDDLDLLGARGGENDVELRL